MGKGNQKWSQPLAAKLFPQFFNHWRRPIQPPTMGSRTIPVVIWGVIAGFYFGLGYYLVFGPF